LYGKEVRAKDGRSAIICPQLMRIQKNMKYSKLLLMTRSYICITMHKGHEREDMSGNVLHKVFQSDKHSSSCHDRSNEPGVCTFNTYLSSARMSKTV